MKSITKENFFFDLLRYTICAIVFLIIAVPLYISVMGGFKSVGQLRAMPMALPDPFETSQYTNMLIGKSGYFWRELVNSLIVGLGTVATVLFTGTFAAYALARIKFKLNKAIYVYFWFGLLFPLAVAILPLYVQLRNFGLLDTRLGVILPQAAFGLPMMLMLLRGFIKQIPMELEEAATMDGYGKFGFLFRIVLPLSTPILATVSVLSFVASWNNFFTPLLVFNTQSKFTLPMGVMDFMGEHAADWNLILAFLTLAMIPAIIIYIFCQKYIVTGLTGGAIKG
ncbi:MAG TPA: carbohydrate ABC transporter permease [Treponemataceae bacterium]|nr:carbohydrate ABC transporter permease [Treponemataceae bacterium]